jgi:hypothetical protein
MSDQGRARARRDVSVEARLRLWTDDAHQLGTENTEGEQRTRNEQNQAQHVRPPCAPPFCAFCVLCGCPACEPGIHFGHTVLGPDLLRLGNAESAGVVWEGPGQKRYGNGQMREAGNGQMREVGSEMREAAGGLGDPFALLPEGLQRELRALGNKPSQQRVRALIVALCELAPRTKHDLANLLGRKPKHIAERYLGPMLLSGAIVLEHPDPTHPNQAYRAATPPKEDDE